MNDLKTEFIRQAAADLKKIRGKLDLIRDEILPEIFFREISRKLHTIKGTAQTFNLPAAARLAHTLENLLSGTDNEAVFSEDKRSILIEGVSHLKTLLHDGEFQTPDDFKQKIAAFQTAPTFQIAQNPLPAEISAKLSAGEKASAANASANGKDLFVIKISFSAAVFAEEFRRFRGEMETNGEVIAALPAASTSGIAIDFQIIFAAKSLPENFIRRTNAEIVFQTSQKTPENLPEMLAKIAAHGRDLAATLGKRCEIKISSEEIELTAEKLKLIFDALLHLIRNAVDHGIAAQGVIEIVVRRDGNRLFIKLADDGKGIDGDRVRKSAIGKNIIAADDNLSGQEINELIFAHGLTTAEKVSEISGRGAGLDAVKTLIENADGTISVGSERGKGAAFVIYLPA